MALAAARIEDIRLPDEDRLQEVYAPRLRALTLVTGGLLGDTSAAGVAATPRRATQRAGSRRGRRPSPAHPRGRLAASPARPTVAPRSPRPARPAVRPLGGRGPRLLRRVPEGALVDEPLEHPLLRQGIENEYGDRLELEDFRDPPSSSACSSDLGASPEDLPARARCRLHGTSCIASLTRWRGARLVPRLPPLPRRRTGRVLVRPGVPGRVPDRLHGLRPEVRATSASAPTCSRS